MTRYIVDRLEEGIAVCETSQKEFIKIPLDQLPEKVRASLREGSVLTDKGQGLCIDDEATAQRRKELRSRLMDLFQKPDATSETGKDS